MKKGILSSLLENDAYKRFVVLCMLAITILTLKVWIGREFIEHVPISHKVAFEEPIHVALFGLFILTMIAIVVKPANDYFVYTNLAIYVILSLSDINRIQPYFISFYVLLLIPANATRQSRGLITIVSIAVSYICAGFNKMNPSFEYEVAPHFYLWLGMERSEALDHLLALTLPAIELIIGVLLLLPFSKRLGHTTAIAMHLVILPVKIFAGGYEVLPWNVLFLILHFAYYNVPLYDIDLKKELSILLLLGVYLCFPILGYMGKINYVYTFPMYTGEDMRGAILISDEMVTRLPQHYKDYIHKMGNDNIIVIERVIGEQLHVAPYPDHESFKVVARDLLPYIKNENDMILLVKRGFKVKLGENLWAYRIKDL